MSNSALTLEDVFEEVGWIAKWEARGEARGEEKGRAESTLEIARKMKEMNFSNEQIQTATGLPAKTIEQL